MAAGSTYTPIATTTLGSTTSTVTFNSFSGYTDLIIISAAKSTGTTESIMLRFNGDSGNNYSFTYLFGTGSAAASGRQSNLSFSLGGFASQNYQANIVHIMNYANTTTYKTSLERRNDASSQVFQSVSLWRSTAAITSLTLQPENGQSFASGSTFTLYGIAAA
jgi:hypothetical protein